MTDIAGSAPANAGEIQAGRFRPGQSGNPKGRGLGSGNKTALALEALLDGQAEALTQRVIDKALEGDMAALCFTMPTAMKALQPAAEQSGPRHPEGPADSRACGEFASPKLARARMRSR
jgi:hypothetical protein